VFCQLFFLNVCVQPLHVSHCSTLPLGDYISLRALGAIQFGKKGHARLMQLKSVFDNAYVLPTRVEAKGTFI